MLIKPQKYEVYIRGTNGKDNYSGKKLFRAIDKNDALNQMRAETDKANIKILEWEVTTDSMDGGLFDASFNRIMDRKMDIENDEDWKIYLLMLEIYNHIIKEPDCKHEWEQINKYVNACGESCIVNKCMTCSKNKTVVL